MFAFVPLDLGFPDHSRFIYDLLTVCADDMLDDYNHDIVMLMGEAHQRILSGQTYAFLITDEGNELGINSSKPELIGAVWLDVDRFDVGQIHGGLLPKYRQGFRAAKIFKSFIAWCFQYLSIRKIEGWLPIENKSAAAVLRWCGFVKEGLIREGLTKHQKPQHLLILGLTRHQWTGGLSEDGQFRKKSRRRGQRRTYRRKHRV